MRLPHISLCFVLIALVSFGCSKAFTNPNIQNSKQADAQFERDSVNCEVVAGEEYPLDKRRQLEVYKKCMESKGWKERGNFEVDLPEKGRK